VHGTDCIFITNWLTSKRPFYSFVNETDPKLTNTFDLLCAGTEITSGGQRRHTYASMIEGIVAKGLNPDDFEDYLSIFKFGMPPHGGFGIGLERLTMTLLKLQNIREVSLFPSDPKRIAGKRLKAKIYFGAENVRNEIIRRLKDIDAPYQHLKHEATPTSEDSARVRGTSVEDGVKALLLRGKTTKKNIQVNIPAHLKLDMKAVADVAGEKFEFEDADVIMKRFGIAVGGIPPWGNLLGVETFLDEQVLTRASIAFNCGLQTESIVMQAKDLAKLTEAKLGKFAKS
jgi:nondiscriminating aspartyl-tRNA synthetase